MYIFSEDVMWKRRHRLFFSSPFSEFGANVEMFTQIIAQGHFKWTELTIRMCTWTLAPALCHILIVLVSLNVRAFSFEIIWRILAVWGCWCAVSVYGTKGRVGWWNVCYVLRESIQLTVELINVTPVTFFLLLLLTQLVVQLFWWFLISFLLKFKSYSGECVDILWQKS